MKNRGFTLVELLGVIIILSILGTISTMIVMNAIEVSKKNSVINSAEQIIKSATISYTTNDNFTTDKIDILTLDLEGAKPESGYIQFDENEKVRLYMIKDGYCVAKTYDTLLEATKEGEFEVCDWYTSSKTERIESTSTILTLNDVKEGKFLNYKIYGNSYQETRSGKNLFNINNITNTSYITNNGDGTITVKSYGNATTGKTLQKLCPEMQVGDIITFSMTKTGYQSIYLLKDQTYWSNGSTKTITQSMLDSMVYFYTDVNDKTTPVVISKIQFEKGTSVTEYEPYGTMPSPEYPSEIQSLGRYNTETKKYEIPIKVINKNFYTESNFTSSNGLTVEYDPDTHIYTVNGTSTNAGNLWLSNNFVPDIKAGEDVTLTTEIVSGTIDNNGKYVYYSMFDNNNKSYIRNQEKYLLNTGKISKSAKMINGDYMHYCIQFGGEGVTFNNVKIRVQLEKGTVSTEYEPHKEKNYTIELDKPLRCVGDVCDYIDFESQTIVRYIEEIILTGNESGWSTATWNGGFGTALANALPYNMYRNTGLSSHDIINTAGFKNPGIVLGNNNKNIYWVGVLDALSLTDITEFKYWLKEQNNNGIPVVIQYLLEKSEYEPISLPKIEVFDGTNNILVTDGNLSASKIEVVALKK